MVTGEGSYDDKILPYFYIYGIDRDDSVVANNKMCCGDGFLVAVSNKKTDFEIVFTQIRLTRQSLYLRNVHFPTWSDVDT